MNWDAPRDVKIGLIQMYGPYLALGEMLYTLLL
jgi:hypothetical protein